MSATVAQIANATQNSLAALVGGQVVPGYYTANMLQPGQHHTPPDLRLLCPPPPPPELTPTHQITYSHTHMPVISTTDP